MPLGRSRPRRGRLSSNGCTKDVLHDQLLISLAQGGEPLATMEEYCRWLHAWQATNRDRPALSEMPWPVQRRWALYILEAFSWQVYRDFNQTVRLLEMFERTQPRPSTREDWATLEGRVKEEEPQLRAEWEAWRHDLIEAYRLEGLVSQ